MNTSAKGRAYEWAVRDELKRQGAKWVMRAAASRGPFDLLSLFSDAVVGIQCKYTMTCAEAQRHADLLPVWPNLMGFVYHRRVVRHQVEKEFCVHGPIASVPVKGLATYNKDGKPSNEDF